MFSRISQGLVLALSLTAATFAVGCAGHSEDDTSTGEGNATAGAALSHDYEGTIGNLKVLVRLDAQGTAITGSYFYSDKVGNGDQLILKGSTQGTKLTMTESVNGAGATTGTFSGDVSSTGIKGSWKAGNTTLPLTLTPIKAFKTVQHKYNATIKAPVVAGEDWHRDCSLEAEVVEIYGLEPKAEKAMMDALHVDPLERDEKGQCESDIRYVSQTVAYNANGILVIDGGTEYDGGAHPENQADAWNFNVATGAPISPNDMFLAGSKAKLKTLIEAAMLKEDPEAAKVDEDGFGSIPTFEEHWDLTNDDMQYVTMTVTEKGITINMGNSYPHVILALAPIVTLSWADLKPLLDPSSPVAALAK